MLQVAPFLDLRRDLSALSDEKIGAAGQTNIVMHSIPRGINRLYLVLCASHNGVPSVEVHFEVVINGLTMTLESTGNGLLLPTSTYTAAPQGIVIPGPAQIRVNAGALVAPAVLVGEALFIDYLIGI